MFVELFTHIIDSHLVNHYENPVPNMILFFILGGYIFASENRNMGYVYMFDRWLTGSIASAMASILFGQFMVFVLLMWFLKTGGYTLLNFLRNN